MHFFKILAPLCSLLAASAHAIPTAVEAEQTKQFEARNNQVAGVYACNDANWSGGCWWQQTSGGLCHSWNPSGQGSFGPDNGIKCFFYKDYTCGASYGGVAGPVENPGLHQVQGGQFMNAAGFSGTKANSFKCRWTTS